MTWVHRLAEVIAGPCMSCARLHGELLSYKSVVEQKNATISKLRDQVSDLKKKLPRYGKT